MNQKILNPKMQSVINDIERIQENKIKEQEQKLNQGIVEVQVIQEIQITKEDFLEYEDCRMSGLTNMFDLSNVEMITGLDKDKIKAIIKEYSKLKEMYLK